MEGASSALELENEGRGLSPKVGIVMKLVYTYNVI